MGEYRLSIEPEKRLLRIVMTGFFSLKEVEAMEKERAALLAQLGCLPNQHITFCDIRDMQISPPEVVNAFARIAGDPRLASRRLAMVSRSSLARGQARRVATNDNVAYFEDPLEAETWLLR